MDLIEELQIQRALSDAFDKLNTKKEAIYKQHNLNRIKHSVEETEKSWQLSAKKIAQFANFN